MAKTEPLSLFDVPVVLDATIEPGTVELHDGSKAVVATITLRPSPREAFLTGMFAHWISGETKPTKDQRAQAARAAAAALAILDEPREET